MLWTIALILLVLWLLGMVSSYAIGGFIHILLVLAVVAVLIRLIEGTPGGVNAHPRPPQPHRLNSLIL